MKNSIVHARMSASEKKEIEQLAANQGCSVSEYVRDAALHNYSNRVQQTNEQIILARLCELADLIEQIDDRSLRRKLEDWRHSTWQSIK